MGCFTSVSICTASTSRSLSTTVNKQPFLFVTQRPCPMGFEAANHSMTLPLSSSVASLAVVGPAISARAKVPIVLMAVHVLNPFRWCMFNGHGLHFAQPRCP